MRATTTEADASDGEVAVNALAALREGDTLVAPKLDRLARSVPDARAIGHREIARMPAKNSARSVS